MKKHKENKHANFHSTRNTFTQIQIYYNGINVFLLYINIPKVIYGDDH